VSQALAALQLSGRRARILAALAAFLLGLSLFYTAGLAAPSALHNATHDTRHAFGLPCH